MKPLQAGIRNPYVSQKNGKSQYIRLKSLTGQKLAECWGQKTSYSEESDYMSVLQGEDTLHDKASLSNAGQTFQVFTTHHLQQAYDTFDFNSMHDVQGWLLCRYYDQW